MSDRSLLTQQGDTCPTETTLSTRWPPTSSPLPIARILGDPSDRPIGRRPCPEESSRSLCRAPRYGAGDPMPRWPATTAAGQSDDTKQQRGALPGPMPCSEVRSNSPLRRVTKQRAVAPQCGARHRRSAGPQAPRPPTHFGVRRTRASGAPGLRRTSVCDAPGSPAHPPATHPPATSPGLRAQPTACSALCAASR